MIDNLKLIESIIDFPNEDTFYKIEIIVRRKDNPDLTSNTKLVKTYYITGKEKLERVFEKEIKPICDALNARASFYLSKRSFEKTAFAALKQLTDNLITHDYKAAKRAYNSACGKTCNGGEGKRWIFDLDEKNEAIANKIDELVTSVGGKVYAHIPTKHGIHIITSAFNIKEYESLMSEKLKNFPHELEVISTMDIHKDNGTILYIPDNE